MPSDRRSNPVTVLPVGLFMRLKMEDASGIHDPVTFLFVSCSQTLLLEVVSVATATDDVDATIVEEMVTASNSVEFSVTGSDVEVDFEAKTWPTRTTTNRTDSSFPSIVVQDNSL